MRRKDLLIIVSVLIIITFGAVFAIYYAVNGDNIFGGIKETIADITENKRPYHSNGWETAIVDKIKDDVPIPVGFTYIEGKQNTGIIIENNSTKEKYMWIPYEETNEIGYEEASSLGLALSSYEQIENIEKYGGFYIVIEDKTEEEKFDEYLKENTNSFDEYYEIKKLGYEEYKKVYKEQTGEELNLNKIRGFADEVNKSRTESVETHTMTLEELANVKAFNEQIGNKISTNGLKTLTVLGTSNEEDEASIETEKSEENDDEQTEEIDERIVTKVEDKNGDIAYVPKGFKEIEGTTVETGFKIKNTDNLSFIWIPVEDVDKVKEEFKENAEDANLTDSIIEGYEKYEDDEESEEYKELIESIKTYGGFYISEAELGYDKNGNTINRFRSMIEKWGEGTGYNYVSNGDYYRNVDSGNYAAEGTVLREKQSTFKLTYDNAIKVAKELYGDSEVAVSHLTYGIEYDAVVNYIIEANDDVDTEIAFKNSTEVGKYKGTEDKRSQWEKENYLNGIYGLAGNLAEITQEKDGENIVLRGGSWNDFGTTALASRISKEESQMDIGQDADGNDKLMGMVGFRACLYIKTNYEENEELETKRKKAVDNLKEYINNTSIKIGEVEYFNNKYNDESQKYELEILNNIVEHVEERIKKETSSTSFNKILEYGKDEIFKLVYNLAEILGYPKYEKGYTYGEINGECWNIKTKAVEEMEKLTWKNGVLTNELGEETTYQKIRIEAEDGIEEVRKNYKEKIYNEEIENYINSYHSDVKDSKWVIAIKDKAHDEILYTKNLEEVRNIAVKYQEQIETDKENAQIQEIAQQVADYEPSTWDYAYCWYDDVNKIKAYYIGEIKATTDIEEAERLKTLAEKTIEMEISSQIDAVVSAKNGTYNVTAEELYGEDEEEESTDNGGNSGGSSSSSSGKSSGSKKDSNSSSGKVGSSGNKGESSSSGSSDLTSYTEEDANDAFWEIQDMIVDFRVRQDVYAEWYCSAELEQLERLKESCINYKKQGNYKQAVDCKKTAQGIYNKIKDFDWLQLGT